LTSPVGRYERPDGFEEAALHVRGRMRCQVIASYQRWQQKVASFSAGLVVESWTHPGTQPAALSER